LLLWIQFLKGVCSTTVTDVFEVFIEEHENGAGIKKSCNLMQCKTKIKNNSNRNFNSLRTFVRNTREKTRQVQHFVLLLVWKGLKRIPVPSYTGCNHDQSSRYQLQ